MKRPYRMPYVLDAACIVVIGLNLPFAVYGYLLFGSNVEGECNYELITPGSLYNTKSVGVTLEQNQF